MIIRLDIDTHAVLGEPGTPLARTLLAVVPDPSEARAAADAVLHDGIPRDGSARMTLTDGDRELLRAHGWRP